ncbi:phosphatase inhibitor 2-like protein [Tanacetum coccineum]
MKSKVGRMHRKRRHFFSELEEKSHAKEAEKTKLQKKGQSQNEKFKNLRKNLTSKEGKVAFSFHVVFKDDVKDTWIGIPAIAYFKRNIESWNIRSASFKDHRRDHYDELHQVRELRRKASLHESSNDDDDEKLNEKRDTPSSLAVTVEDTDIIEMVQKGWHFHQARF